MRILITDENAIWTPDNPALEPYADLILVICLNGIVVTDKYRCFVSPYKHTYRLGMDSYGPEDAKYEALESVADKLEWELDSDNNIIILADDTPSSLYPFSVLKDKMKSMHLCTVSPWRFEHSKRKSSHREMLQDLSSLSSLFYINSNLMINELGPGAKIHELFEKTASFYEKLLPNILFGIQERDWSKAFFDFYTKSYLPLKEGFDMIEEALNNQEVDPKKIMAFRTLTTMGLVIEPEYPSDEKYIINSVEALIPRPNGKEICNYLRNLRIELANANQIPFVSEKCPSVGPCAGTCEKCDRESRYLFEKIQELPDEEIVYPKYILDKWEGSL